MINFKSHKADQSISEDAFMDAAEDLDCDIAAIKAVAEVESSGNGFLEDGRPKILFERHKFRKYTGGLFNNSHPDISGPPGNYQGGASEYVRLDKAMQLNTEAALLSTSWGKFQIMGFNHEICGFADIEAFVEAMVESEDRQLESFIGFVEGNNLAQYLRNHDWAKFARRYNGPSYRKNRYHTKMAQFYEKYASEARPLTTDTSLSQGTNTNFQVDSVRNLQKALDYLGISPGIIDNKLGPNTRSAIKTFQRFAQLPETGDYEVSLRASVQTAYYMMKKFDLLDEQSG